MGKKQVDRLSFGAKRLYFFVNLNMEIIKTYKYKLRPTKSQIKKFEQWLGCTRLVYNLAKETSQYHYEATGKTLSNYDLQKQVVQLKKDYDWMRELPKDTLVEPCFRFDKALKRFFKGGGFPKWAKKRKWNSLVFVQQNKTGLRIENGKIKLHKGVRLRYFNSRPLPEDAKIKNITIKKEIDGWYASIQFKTDMHQVVPVNDSQVVGADIGVSRFLALSDGQYFDNPRVLKQFQTQIAFEQQKLAGKVKGSNNYKKQGVKIAKLHRKVARTRKHFHHQVANRLINEYGGVVVEDLQVRNMTKRCKPKTDGKKFIPNGQSAKSGLNKSMLDVAPSEFFRILEYKSSWNNRYFEKVNHKYTSQTCSCCGHKSKENRESQSKFACKSCGFVCNADENAAKNILSRGRTVPSNLNYA